MKDLQNEFFSLMHIVWHLGILPLQRVTHKQQGRMERKWPCSAGKCVNCDWLATWEEHFGNLQRPSLALQILQYALLRRAWLWLQRSEVSQCVCVVHVQTSSYLFYVFIFGTAISWTNIGVCRICLHFCGTFCGLRWGNNKPEHLVPMCLDVCSWRPT